MNEEEAGIVEANGLLLLELVGEKGGFFSFVCFVLLALLLPMSESISANGSSSNVKLLFRCITDADLFEDGIVLDKFVDLVEKFVNKSTSKSSVSYLFVVYQL